MSEVIAIAVRKSALKCRYAPRPPMMKNSVASPARNWVDKSRPHCHEKYWIHIPIWAVRDAWRCHTGGLPYCWRVSTSHSADQLVGSPSLIAGKCAERIGRERQNGEP